TRCSSTAMPFSIWVIRCSVIASSLKVALDACPEMAACQTITGKVIALDDFAYGALHQSESLTDGLLMFSCPHGLPDFLIPNPDGHLLGDIQQHSTKSGGQLLGGVHANDFYYLWS
nr:hypothetical protein [Endozoicomonas sp.]